MTVFDKWLEKYTRGDHLEDWELNELLLYMKAASDTASRAPSLFGVAIISSLALKVQMLASIQDSRKRMMGGK